jgi:cysteamine dioxygenase
MTSKLYNLVSLSLNTFKIMTTKLGPNKVDVSVVKSEANYDNMCMHIKQLTMKDLNFTLVDDLNENLNEFNRTCEANLTKYTAYCNKDLTRFIRNRYRNRQTRQDHIKLNNLLVYLNSPAPVLCMSLYNEPFLTLNIFLIRMGSSIPTHNHPNMNGIIKILHGSGTLISYTPLEGDSDDFLLAHQEFTKQIDTNQHDLLTLKPIEYNIHEIKASPDEDLIFFDVITPSYELNCNYYEPVTLVVDSKNDENNQQLVYLKKVETPKTYFCDTLVFVDQEDS